MSRRRIHGDLYQPLIHRYDISKTQQNDTRSSVFIEGLLKAKPESVNSLLRVRSDMRTTSRTDIDPRNCLCVSSSQRRKASTSRNLRVW